MFKNPGWSTTAVWDCFHLVWFPAELRFVYVYYLKPTYLSVAPSLFWHSAVKTHSLLLSGLGIMITGRNAVNIGDTEAALLSWILHQLWYWATVNGGIKTEKERKKGAEKVCGLRNVQYLYTDTSLSAMTTYRHFKSRIQVCWSSHLIEWDVSSSKVKEKFSVILAESVFFSPWLVNYVNVVIIMHSTVTHCCTDWRLCR